MTTGVGILGGDSRELRVAELLKSDGHDVAVFGHDPSKMNGLSNSVSVEDAVTGREWIICPAPGLGEHDQLYAPGASEPLYMTESLLSLSSAARGGLVLGKTSPTLAGVAEKLNIPVYEFKQDRALAVVVASAVAEALVAELIAATKRVLREMHVLVLGYGATGSAIADILVALGCSTSIMSRDEVKAEIARRRGANPLRFGDWEKILGGVDVVVNTVPNQSAVGANLFPGLVGKTVIDISSPPGGLVHEAAREAGVNVIWARGLAGRRAPLTVGEAQFEFIRRAMDEMR